MKKILLFIIVSCIGLGFWFVYSEIYSAEAQEVDSVTFSIEEGESVSAVASRLEEEDIIRSAWFFKKYLTWKNLDRDVRQGSFVVEAPITLARVVAALANPSINERSITIIPGWNIRDVAQYFEREGMHQAEELTELVGLPAINYKTWQEGAPDLGLDFKILEDKPWYVSYEGYLSPDTFRIFKDATLQEIVTKLIAHRDSQFSEQMYIDIEAADRTPFEVLTMASILEREVRSREDRELVADIFWRRYDLGWALQADSTVHYAVNKVENVFTTKEDRESLSPWNTYKYPGLPLGPICNPSLESIMAAIYPEENDYWYFLTDSEGTVHYAKTLEEHNENRVNFL